MNALKMHAHIEEYRRRRWVDVATDSGTGSYILKSSALCRIVKFNQDPAYDKFATYAVNQPSPALPRIFIHDRPLGDFKPLSNAFYTVTELEELTPLSTQERQDIGEWLRSLMKGKDSLQTTDSSIDPFGLREPFERLRQEAARVQVGLDLQKGTNVMKRESNLSCDYVFTDPFG